MGKKSKVMTTIPFTKQSLSWSSITWEKYCKKRNSFNRIFAHLVSILIKDRYQHTLSYYCGRRIRIFRHFSRLQRENLSASGFATSDHRHVDKLTSRPRTQSSEVIVGTHCVHRILVRDKIYISYLCLFLIFFVMPSSEFLLHFL